MELHHSSEQEAPKKVTKLFLNMPLGDSVTSSTWIRFSVHTGAPRIHGELLKLGFSVAIRDKPIAPASPLAEWLCRTVDRIDPARVLGPRYCFGPGTSAPDSKIIRRLLQLRQNASVFAQGCADFSSDSSDRNHSFTPDPRRASPSLRSDLVFGTYTSRQDNRMIAKAPKANCDDRLRKQRMASSAGAWFSTT